MNEEFTVYRVQDATGRGPWRPGFSSHWIDGGAPAGRLTETIMDLMPLADLAALPRSHHYGCACRSLEALMSWFTPAERGRLEAFRFYPVKIRINYIVAESQTQLLAARRRPFAEGATRLRWP